MQLSDFLRTTIFVPLNILIGRRNLYRISKFLMNEARRDVRRAYDSRRSGEPAVQQILLQYAPTDSSFVAFDVGANRGEWTASFRDLAQKNRTLATIHAFEPCKATYQVLSERARHNEWNNVVVRNQACSSSPGTAVLNVYEAGSGINTIVDPLQPGANQHEEVALTTVDAYCAANGIHRIDFLKIDTEGNDFEVMLGASSMLRNQSIQVIQFEYNFRWIGARRYLRDVFALLSPFGYAVGKITLEGVEFYTEWNWEIESYREGNYIACKKEWLDRFHRLSPTWLTGPPASS